MNRFKNLNILPWLGGNKTNIGVELGAIEIFNLIKGNFDENLIKLINHENLNNCDYHNKIYNESNKLEGNTLNIGGDHSISIGTVLSSINKNHSTGVIWIDAHPDINTLESSLTKRTHGMPLSFITGIENKWKWTNDLKFLNYDKLHYWGIRDIDPFEKNLIKKENINVHKNLNSLIESIKEYDNLHISLDIDAIDPFYTASTGTPVENGLELYEVLDFLKTVFREKNNYNLDIVEYNPSIGSKLEKAKTLNSLKKIIDI
jgi:arginase